MLTRIGCWERICWGRTPREVINLFAFAIRFGISAKDLKHMIYAYPTSASDLPYML